MFGKRIKLFELLGFEVKIDISWIIIAALITWTLAQGVFPHYYKNLSSQTYLWMGILGALGLFASIIFHELCHSLVARRFGLPIKGITLFIFGGVAEMEDEPPSAKAEFFMAIAGPLASILLGVLFYGIYFLSKIGGWAISITGVFRYIGFINFLLAGFNLLPAFPLDGGRVLRSALWSWKGSLRWSTRIASWIGSGFGFVLIFLGIVNVIRGAFIGGIWWIFIGVFLRNASQMSYQKMLMKKTLEGEPVRRFMNTEYVTAPANISIKELVEDYIYKHHFKMFPVVEDDKLIGCITTKEIKEISKNEWDEYQVKNLLKECSPDNTVSPDEDAKNVLSDINRTGNSRLMVVEDEKLVGIITLKDLLDFLSLKLDLEKEELEKRVKNKMRA